MEQNTQMTADQVRSAIVAKYSDFKSHIAAYHEYATQVGALAIEYHLKRLDERAPVSELTLVLSLPGHETPKSLDVKLSELDAAGVIIKQVIFDRVNSTFMLFA